MITNTPAAIGKITAFKENPLTVTIVATPPYTIVTPVTVEVWTAGVKNTNINPTVNVSGQTITFTLSVVMLRLIGKNSYLYVKFGDRYELGDVIEVVMTASIPSSKTIFVSSTSGTIRVSAFSDQANASVATAQATIATTKAAQATQAAADALQAASTVQLTSGYYAELVDAVLTDDDQDWQDTIPTVTSSAANGASVNSTTRVITIPSGAAGTNSYIQKVFSLSNYEGLNVGDVVQIRDIWIESPLNSLGANDLTITRSVNGGSSSVITPVRQSDSGIVYFFTNYTVASLTDSITLRYTVASSSVRSTSTTFTWNATELTYNAKIYSQAAGLIGTGIGFLNSSVYPFIERSARISGATGNGTTDDAARMQDEIYDAIATSGKYELRKDKIYKVLSKLTINGGLHIYGYNRSGARINGDTASMNIFEVDTVSPVWFSDFEIGRSANVTATAIKFLSNFLNKDSRIEGMRITSVKGLEIFSTDGLRALHNEFQGPQNPVTIDTSAAVGTVLNTVFDWNRFIDCDLNAFDVYSVNNLTIANSRCRSTATTYINNFVRLSLKYIATNEGLFLYGNNASDIQNNGLVVSTDANVFLKRAEIYDNTFRCQSAAASANCISLTAGSSNGIEDVSVEMNKLYNKLYGVVGTNLKNFIFGGGRVIGDNTSGSRAINLTNSSYLMYPAIRAGQATADTTTGSTLLT